MERLKDWGPGFRLFKCDDCGIKWKEASRDCTSFSGVTCPNEECTDSYASLVSPHGYEPHFDWPTDKSGNLLDGHDYET